MVKQSEDPKRFLIDLLFFYQLYGGLFHIFCESTAHLYKDKNKTLKRLCIGNVRWIFVLRTFSFRNNFFAIWLP